MPAFQHNPDGSWTPAEPIPYAPGIDWEVSTGPDGIRTAHAYIGARQVGTVRAGNRLFLALGLRWATWRLRRKYAGTLLALLAVLLLAACGEGAGGNSVSVDYLDRPGGGQVECASNSGGGMSCDWDGASR